jgi:hypothetical protein
MCYNDFENDPLSQCDVYNHTCSPPYFVHLAIASRKDLNDPIGEQPKHALSNRRGFGATDTKITNSKMVKNFEMLAVSGPTDEQ